MLTQTVCKICNCNFFYKTENVKCLDETLYCTKCLNNSKNKSKRRDEINDYDMFGNLDNDDDLNLNLNTKKMKTDNIKNNNKLHNDYRNDNNYKKNNNYRKENNKFNSNNKLNNNIINNKFNNNSNNNKFNNKFTNKNDRIPYNKRNSNFNDNKLDDKRRRYSYDDRKNTKKEKLDITEKDEEDIVRSLLSNLLDSDNIKIYFDTKTGKKNYKNTLEKETLRENVELDSNIELNENKPNVSEFPFEYIGDNINNLEDLIKKGESYDSNLEIQTNLDLYKLNKLVPSLKKLNDMIGLKKIKDAIFHQVIFHLQDLDVKNVDMHHTVINGPPGVGKTELSKIIAEIYNHLGFLKSNKVTSVKRNDLIAGYLGQTALKTKKILDEALGGVLLIDEAYALGDSEGRDSFSKEAIDLLTSYLSEHGHEFICIIAGYKKALEERFFKINEGLSRRFTINYTIEPYNSDDLKNIFVKIVTDNKWKVDESESIVNLFNNDDNTFPNYGGDMLSLFSYCKKAHSGRILKLKSLDEIKEKKLKITKDDIIKGLEFYSLNNSVSVKKKSFVPSMYL